MNIQDADGDVAKQIQQVEDLVNDAIIAVNNDADSIDSVTIKSSESKSGKVIVATYKNHMLTGIKIVDVVSANYTDGTAAVNVGLSLDDDETIKVIFVENIENISPIFNAYKK